MSKKINKENVVFTEVYNGHTIEIECDKSLGLNQFKVIIDGSGTTDAAHSIIAGLDLGKLLINNMIINKKKKGKKRKL